LDVQFQAVKKAVDEKRTTLKLAIPEDLLSLNESSASALAVYVRLHLMTSLFCFTPVSRPASDKSSYAGESVKLEASNLAVIREAVGLFGLHAHALVAVHASAVLGNHYDDKEVCFRVQS
jgi:hypothetical protein